MAQMTTSIDSRAGGGRSDAGETASWRPEHAAGRALARASRAGLLLGLLGLASFTPVLVRLLESWRLSPHAVSHHVAILGQTLS